MAEDYPSVPDGVDRAKESVTAPAPVTYVPEHSGFNDRLTIADYFYARGMGVSL